MKRLRTLELRSFVTLAAFYVAFFGPAVSSIQAQIFKPIGLSIDDFVNYEGVRTFQFQAYVFNPTSARTELLTSPSGFVFNETQIHLPLASSVSEIRDQIVGQWTFTTMLVNQPQSLETYHFTVADFDPESLGVERPTILTPMNGGTIQHPATFQWSPPTIGYTLGVMQLLSHPEAQPGSLTLYFDAPPGPGAYVELTIGNGKSLDGVIAEGPPPSASPYYDLFLDFSFGKSTQIRVTPVPEPGAIGIAGIALALCAAATRRIARTRRG